MRFKATKNYEFFYQESANAEQAEPAPAAEKPATAEAEPATEETAPAAEEAPAAETAE